MITTCPACGITTEAKRKLSVTAIEAAQHFVLAEEHEKQHGQLAQHIQELWNSPSCDIVECTQCSLGYAWPFVAGDSVFYNLAYPHSDYPRKKWEFILTTSVLSQLHVHGAKALEIGSGFGYFLELVSPVFFLPTDIVAVEFNENASKKLKKCGYTVLQADIRSDEFLRFEKLFDYVFMFQVLEHMDQLDELVQRLLFITNNHANIFLAVPNSTLTNFSEQHGSLLDMPPNHISRWNEKSFHAFAERNGFEVVEFRQEPISWPAFAKQDLVYSYMRRSQRSGSFENRVRSSKRSRFRRFKEAMLALTATPSRIGAWASAVKSEQSLGGSLWIHLRRKS